IHTPYYSVKSQLNRSFLINQWTPKINTLSLHDALPISERRRTARYARLAGFGEIAQRRLRGAHVAVVGAGGLGSPVVLALAAARSEEHTSELQSRENLVCRLLLQKKKNKDVKHIGSIRV